jgi:hypothetical protein
MEEDNDVYYVDSRNADPRRIMGFPVGTPSQRVNNVRPSTAARTVYVQPQNTRPMVAPYGQPSVIYTQGPATGMGSIFGNLTAGQVIDMVAQIFAMLQPLPAAPTATTDAPTDIGNSILYQKALAEYAKRDEQVRTIGNLVAKLVG